VKPELSSSELEFEDGTIHDGNKIGPGFSIVGMSPNFYAQGREKEGIELRIKSSAGVEISLLPLRC
jgi:hypothetical protein